MNEEKMELLVKLAIIMQLIIIIAATTLFYGKVLIERFQEGASLGLASLLLFYMMGVYVFLMLKKLK